MVKAHTLWTCCDPPGTDPRLAGPGLLFNSIQAHQGEHAALLAINSSESIPAKFNSARFLFSKRLKTCRKAALRLPSPPTFRLPVPPVALRPGDSAAGPTWGWYRPATRCTVG